MSTSQFHEVRVTYYSPMIPRPNTESPFWRVEEVDRHHHTVVFQVPNALTYQEFEECRLPLREECGSRFWGYYADMAKFVQSLADKYDACADQLERIRLYWSTVERVNADLLRKVNNRLARESVTSHVGAEKNVEEIWETLYFLASGNSAEYYSGLVKRYIAGAEDVYSLSRLYVFLRFQTHDGSFLEELAEKMIGLKMASSERREVLKLVTCNRLEMSDFRRHVHSTILRSMGMQ